jgi:hypothetical protein
MFRLSATDLPPQVAFAVHNVAAVLSLLSGGFELMVSRTFEVTATGSTAFWFVAAGLFSEYGLC